jgi:hypothetical protein
MDSLASQSNAILRIANRGNADNLVGMPPSELCCSDDDKVSHVSNVQTLENVGREGFIYIKEILEHSARLHHINVFCQADMNYFDYT